MQGLLQRRSDMVPDRALLRDDQPHGVLLLESGGPMKRVPVTPRYRGPQTKRSERLRVEMLAKLSEECGWGKPVVKLPKEKA
jgi:hypothetical protein